jgi:hypothetical protein
LPFKIPALTIALQKLDLNNMEEIAPFWKVEAQDPFIVKKGNFVQEGELCLSFSFSVQHY